jgi:hypothetical protein
MNKLIIPAFCLLALLGFQSCYYDKADLLYPGAAKCDTTGTISYSKQIVPLLQQQCLPCHTVSSPDGGIILGTYASDRAIAANGKLFGSLNYTTGYSPMPKGRAKLTTCQLVTIKKWIDGGSPNN